VKQLPKDIAPTTVVDAADAEEETMEEVQAPVVSQRPRTGPDIFDRAWHLLTSVKVAFFIIISIAFASFAGIFLPQVTPEMAGDPADYAQWLERIRPQYGIFTDVLSRLGLFDIFRSIWFRALLGLLSVGIIVCSINRWPGIKASLTTRRVKVGPGFFRAVPLRAEIPTASGGLSGAAGMLEETLRQRGYRVLQQHDPGVSHFYADKHRYSQLGTYALHLGLILILAAAVWSYAGGYRDRSFAIPEGSLRAVGQSSGLTVMLESFADEYYPEGPPKDYRSELVLYKGDQEVRRQTIRVNEPMEYEGWRFHQSFFGPAAVMEVKDSTGTILFSDGVALAWRTTGERPMGSFRMLGQNLNVYLVGPSSKGMDPVIKAGELRLEVYKGSEGRPIIMDNIFQGRPLTVEGLTFTFLRERQFSGLQIVNDPAVPLMYFAWVLCTIGLIVVFYFPYRRLWARCQQEGEDTRVYLGTSMRRDLGLSQEFAAIAERVRERVQALPNARQEQKRNIVVREREPARV